MRYSKLSPLFTSPSMPGHVMVYGHRSPASNDSILRDQVPRQPINQAKLPSNQPIDHSVDHSVDHSISISPLLLQPPRSRRVAVMVMMMIWWLGHAQNPFSGRCVTLQTVESRLTRRPSHPLPGQGKGCKLCGTARNGTAHNGTPPLSIGRLHALSVCTIRRGILWIQGHKLYSRRARIGQPLLLLWGPSSLLAPLVEVGHGTHCEFGT